MVMRRPSGDGVVHKKELTAKFWQEIKAYQGLDLTENSRLTISE